MYDVRRFFFSRNQKIQTRFYRYRVCCSDDGKGIPFGFRQRRKRAGTPFVTTECVFFLTPSSPPDVCREFKKHTRRPVIFPVITNARVSGAFGFDRFRRVPTRYSRHWVYLHVLCTVFVMLITLSLVRRGYNSRSIFVF